MACVQLQAVFSNCLVKLEQANSIDAWPLYVSALERPHVLSRVDTSFYDKLQLKLIC